jgi:predicted metalloprotease
MLWKGRRQSGNIIDRRGIGGLALGGGAIGLIILLINFFMGGGDLGQIGQQLPGGPMSREVEAAQDANSQLVAVVLAETEDVWNELLPQYGIQYEEPRLVLFTNSVQSACGSASSAMGPFYCPQDRQVYIDLAFYQELRDRFGAPGDFAMAYVVAHEIGHHIQNLMGTSGKLQELRSQVSEKEYNRYSVMLELQADFYAGVWAHHAHRMDTILERGDIAEALNAANAIGDDMLQRRSQGYVVPDAFTHGTSEQRVRWFRKGFETGDLRQGDTFNAAAL